MPQPQHIVGPGKHLLTGWITVFLKDPLAAPVKGSQGRKSGAALLSTHCALGPLGGSPHALLFRMVPLGWLLPPGDGR